jgi:hypothetical protein
MFQESELINLSVSLIAFGIVTLTIRKHEIPGFTLFYTGFCCIFAATLFTVIEGVFWNDLFNTLEHLSYGLGGVSFAAGCILLPGNGQKRHGKGSQ